MFDIETISNDVFLMIDHKKASKFIRADHVVAEFVVIANKQGARQRFHLRKTEPVKTNRCPLSDFRAIFASIFNHLLRYSAGDDDYNITVKKNKLKGHFEVMITSNDQYPAIIANTPVQIGKVDPGHYLFQPSFICQSYNGSFSYYFTKDNRHEILVQLPY